MSMVHLSTCLYCIVFFSNVLQFSVQFQVLFLQEITLCISKPYLLQQNCCSSKNSALKHRRKTGNNFPLVQSKTIILHNNKNNIIIIICIYHAHVNIYILINICVWVYLCEIHKHSIYNLNICNQTSNQEIQRILYISISIYIPEK